jgi:hypothetical protein
MNDMECRVLAESEKSWVELKMLAAIDVSLLSIRAPSAARFLKMPSRTGVVADLYLAAIRGAAVPPNTKVDAIERSERDSFNYGRRKGR